MSLTLENTWGQIIIKLKTKVTTKKVDLTKIPEEIGLGSRRYAFFLISVPLAFFFNQKLLFCNCVKVSHSLVFLVLTFFSK